MHGDILVSWAVHDIPLPGHRIEVNPVDQQSEGGQAHIPSAGLTVLHDIILCAIWIVGVDDISLSILGKRLHIPDLARLIEHHGVEPS